MSDPKLHTFTPDSTLLLDVREISKSFGSLKAVDAVSFSVARGQCVGLIGPNGAGKTTTLSMICGLTRPTSGEIRIAGGTLQAKPDAVKRLIGLVPQDLALYEELNAQENLQFFGSLYGIERELLEKRLTSALELVGLNDRRRDKASTFSGGMKRRLNLACSLLHDPQLLLLDEPTVGVDPQSRNAIFDNIRALRAAGKTVVYTTHYMEEVEKICDQVVIIDHGKVIANDTVAGLKNRAKKTIELKLELALSGTGDWLDDLRRQPGVLAADLAASELTVKLTDLESGIARVLEFLRERRQTVVHLQTDRPNLESVFLELTGHQLRDS